MPGRLVKTLTGHDAFLPAPLPPLLNWTNELVAALSAADRALGHLAAIGAGSLSAINPHLFIRPFVQREAVLSSQIEGTQATLSDLVLFEETPAVEQRVPDVREVANYVQALEYGLQQLKNRPLSLALLRELHQILMTGVRGGDRTPGAFRSVQVVIGPTSQIQDARYVRGPPLLVAEAMDEFQRYLDAPSDLPPLVRVALIHYQFEAIHPFQDGNGRIGRLLITLSLCSQQILPLPMLYLSAFFERHRADYYHRLLAVSQKNAWREWITFFLKGVTHEASDALGRAAKLMALRDTYRAQIQTARASALTIKLLDELFSRPVLTTGRAAKILQITPSAAQKHVDRLVSLGIIVQTTNQKRNRTYLATGILDALSHDSPSRR